MRDNKQSPIRIFVSDIQPILPAVAGGRLRLAGIWGNVPAGFEMKYVGTFDIPKQEQSIKKLGGNAVEVLVPCSDEHFLNLSYANAAFPDITLFDLAFHRFAHLSNEYVSESIKYLQKADIVVFSHPWSYPVFKKYLNLDKQFLVYDSQNVESFLRADVLLKPQYGQAGWELLREILEIENALTNDANLVLACSKRDLEQFNLLYGVDHGKLIIAPNGVLLDSSYSRISSFSKKILEKKWRLKRPYSVVFSGSSFEPNVRAFQYINQIAFSSPEIDFIITGNMNNVISPQNLSRNVHLVGLLNEHRLKEVYQLADVGINPMDSGSGSNIKVFTYMGAGIPVLSTPLGARGLDVLDNGFYNGEEALVLATLDVFEQQLKNLLSNPKRRSRIADQAYKMVKSNYSWKEISREVCQTMKSKFQL
jgi:glycosyltransferase involved in cell wall biosynthesis